MPDSKNRRDMELAKYEAMSTEELQALLREDASKPEGEEVDEGVLFCVMEVLAKRRQARNEGKSPEEALESFVKNYMPEDEDAPGTERESTVRRFKPNARRWMSGLVAAAAMIVLVFGMSLTANAFGIDLWDIVVKWTQETFYFDNPGQTSEAGEPEVEDSTPYPGLQTMLEQHNVEAAIVPSWIPEGYEEVDVKTFETPKQRQFVSLYQNGAEEMKIWIADYLDGSPVQIEQSDTVLEVYVSGGIEYFIFSDINQIRVAWIRDSFECCITGPLSIEEMKIMIDSIEKG